MHTQHSHVTAPTLTRPPHLLDVLDDEPRVELHRIHDVAQRAARRVDLVQRDAVACG